MKTMQMKASSLMKVLKKNEDEKGKPKKQIVVFQGSSCFSGDTLIQTSKGHKRIKDIKKGELVLSFDENRKKLVFNKVLERFKYKVTQSLINLKLKNGTKIECTPNHKFYSEGQWISAEELGRRSLEGNKRHKWKLSNKQQGKIKNNELEMLRKGKNNAPSISSEICKNNHNKRETQTSVSPQISSRSIYSKSREQTRGQSYRWEQGKQQIRKSGMGNTLREHKTFIQNRIKKTSEGRVKRDGEIDRKESNRYIKEIRTSKDNNQNVSERVWSFHCDNKNNIRTKQTGGMGRIKGEISAKEIRPSKISQLSFKSYRQKEIYDLSIENTKNYCVTKNNYIVHNSSSKTYTFLQYLIQKALTEWENKTIDIVRRTFPSLRISVLKDFFDIIISMGLYDRNSHNKSESSYKLGTNTFRFYSSDEEQKVRGPRRNIVFFNEVLEFKRMDVIQIMLRTSDLILMDYNPSEEFHWLYEEILKRDDVLFYKSTYKENPFLTQKVINEIERLKEIDINLWRIYGLGERGVTQATIFTNWDYAETNWEDFEGQEFYGMDFGFNNPTALLRIKYHKEGIYCEELLYETGLTSDDIIERLDKLVGEGKLSKNNEIWADSARPEIIEDMRRANYNVHPAMKKQDSVLRGLNFLKNHKILLDKESVNLIKEFRTYKWKVDKDDRILDEPVDLNNHLIDCTRYALCTLSERTEFGVLDGGKEIFG